jgi:hypothetical protein
MHTRIITHMVHGSGTTTGTCTHLVRPRLYLSRRRVEGGTRWLGLSPADGAAECAAWRARLVPPVQLQHEGRVLDLDHGREIQQPRLWGRGGGAAIREERFAAGSGL